MFLLVIFNKLYLIIRYLALLKTFQFRFKFPKTQVTTINFSKPNFPTPTNQSNYLFPAYSNTTLPQPVS